MLKLEHHAQLAAVRGAVQLRPLGIRAPGLAYSDQPLLKKGLPGHFPEKLVEPGAVDGDFSVGILGDLVDDVQPEAGNALVHPEAEHPVQFLPQSGIVPVEVRLFRGELMKIPLPQFWHIFPGGAAKSGPHVVGRGIRAAVTPDVVIVEGVIPGFQRLPEPAVLVGAVVQRQVHQNADPPFLRLRNQGFHVLHGAEQRIDGAEIGNVVTVVHLG